MKSSNTQIEHLKKMLSIEEKRAVLQQQLSELDAQLHSLRRQLGGGAAPAAASSVVKRGPGRPRKVAAPVAAPKTAPAKAPAAGKGGSVRGQLAARITDALKSAGSSGITIKDLCAKFKMPYRNVQVWFATTGKKNPAIKKIAPATYRLVG